MVKKAGGKHIFVAFAHADKEVVIPATEKISELGYTLLYNKVDAKWSEETQAIRKCGIVIAFISKESMASEYVRNEIEYALGKKKKVLPVYLDGTEALPTGLALVLNTAQGVVGKSAEEIAELICTGLEFYGLKRKAGGKKGISAKIFAAAAVILISAAAAGYLHFNGLLKIRKNLVSLSKESYLPAELMNIQVSDLTQKMIDDDALIGIWDPNGKDDEYYSYTYLVRRGRASTDFEGIKLRAPASAGEYEVRFYSSDILQPQNILDRVNFSVSGNTLGAFQLSVDGSEYFSLEAINVSVSEVPQSMLENLAIVGIYKSGAKSSEYLTYIIINERNQQIGLYAPSEAGEYEIRAYSNSEVWNADTLVASAPIEVFASQSVSE
ncbi:MAG: toll/interleukin-1 receptor domain-containing protein [Deferribacteraceae bacterium]|jgi:hypothetical protein|nr:toll/interleukin-1 receptor domain-containing protein [Deferribacteraceae bacterium]